MEGTARREREQSENQYYIPHVPLKYLTHFNNTRNVPERTEAFEMPQETFRKAFTVINKIKY